MLRRRSGPPPGVMGDIKTGNKLRRKMNHVKRKRAKDAAVSLSASFQTRFRSRVRGMLRRSRSSFNLGFLASSELNRPLEEGEDDSEAPESDNESVDSMLESDNSEVKSVGNLAANASGARLRFVLRVDWVGLVARSVAGAQSAIGRGRG
jgi:hypothetical protein